MVKLCALCVLGVLKWYYEILTMTSEIRVQKPLLVRRLLCCQKAGDDVKKWAANFYNSKKWKCCRSAYIAERVQTDGGLCEVCGEKTGFIVHHKISLDSSNIQNPDIALNRNNLMYVCKDCHDQFDGHFYGTRAAKKSRQLTVCFDENGDPEPI